MKTKITNMYHSIGRAVCAGALLLLAAAAPAQNLYVVNDSNGTIGEYGLDGSTINASLVSGLDQPFGIAISGNDLFVVNSGNGTVGEYGLDGSTVNTSLITGLYGPSAIAVSGNDLFVVSRGTVGEYTTSGATVNASLISGLRTPSGIAISGNDIFVVNNGNGTVGEYTTSGVTVNASLISGLNYPLCIAILGNDVFVGNGVGGTVGEYTTSGATVNASAISGLGVPYGMAVLGNALFVADDYYNTVSEYEYTVFGTYQEFWYIAGLDGPIGIAFSPVPEPSVIGFAGIGVGALWLWRRRVYGSWAAGGGDSKAGPVFKFAVPQKEKHRQRDFDRFHHFSDNDHGDYLTPDRNEGSANGLKRSEHREADGQFIFRLIHPRWIRIIEMLNKNTDN